MRFNRDIQGKNIEIVLHDSYTFWEWFRKYMLNGLSLSYNDWYFKSKSTWGMIWYWYRTDINTNKGLINADYLDLDNI